MSDQRLIPITDATGGIICPASGIDGGPVHPAHAAEVAASDRLYRVTERYDETAADVESMHAMNEAAHAVNEYPKMRLYEITATPQQSSPPRIVSYHAAYFKCLTCGFVLPATQRSWHP